MEFIETKVSYDRMVGNGFVKRVTELYLIDAMTFTEAEAEITKEMEEYIHGEFTVSAVKKSNITEIVFADEGDYWYKVKVAYISINEKNGDEKATYQHMLVQATDFKSAYENFMNHMKGTVTDFEIAGITATQFIDVYTTQNV